MDWYLISVLVFIVFLAVIVYKDRKNFKKEFIILTRKTKRGRGSLVKIGKKFPLGWKVVGTVSVIFCFAISIWIVYYFIIITMQNLTAEVVPSVGILLPSLSSTTQIGPGYFAIPFWYWIIAVALLALVHESFHGIFAARENIKIKSLGWGLLLVLPFAFVEPDEKQLESKKPWQKLRVFSAGSFANFILAGVSILVLIIFVSGIYTGMGVAYETYMQGVIKTEDITGINNHVVNDIKQLKEALKNLDKNVTISITTKTGETFFSTPETVLKQLNNPKIIVFADYPAIKNNLSGFIIQINDHIINTQEDLKEVLKKASHGETIEIITSNSTDNKTFSFETAEQPMPVFEPSMNVYILSSMENIIPGSIEYLEGLNERFNSLFGVQKEENWESIQSDIQFWSYIKENYPNLGKSADMKISLLQEQLKNYNRGGFLGIAGVYTLKDVKLEYKPFTEPINFFQGLLFWMFLINFGVGAFNLLPIGPLDGGKMWEILFKKITPKHSKKITNILGYIILILIILNFALIFKGF